MARKVDLFDIVGMQEDVRFSAEAGGEAKWKAGVGGNREIDLSCGLESRRLDFDEFVAINRALIDAVLQKEYDESLKERLILRLPVFPRTRDVLQMTDLHANFAAFCDTMERTNLARNVGGVWTPTKQGEQSTLIIGGDNNDRGKQFVPLANALMDLKVKMDLRTLWGNHELALHALLSDLPLSDAQWERSKLPIVRWVSSEMTRTLKELQVHTYGRDDTLPDATPNEKSWLESKHLIPTYFSDLELGRIIIARRLCTGNGELAPYFAGLQLMTTQDDVLYTHALLNKRWAEILDDGVTREGAVAMANAAWRHMLQDPELLYALAFGEEFDAPTEQDPDAKHFSRPPEASILWRRWKDPTKDMPASVAAVLKAKGWLTQLHGHDVQNAGQNVDTVEGINVAHTDIGLRVPFKRGYTRVTTDHRVMAVARIEPPMEGDASYEDTWD